MKRVVTMAAVLGAALSLGASGVGADEENAQDLVKKEPFELNGNSARGRGIFQNNCIACHGVDGNGQGPLSGAFDPPPGNFTNKARMAGLDDLYLYTIVSEGGPAVGKCMEMGAWKHTLSDQQVRDVVAFIRTFVAEKEGTTERGP